ncbi:hypothetical protein JCM11251_003266 [Rhodosporidiobolus azoricus]
MPASPNLGLDLDLSFLSTECDQPMEQPQVEEKKKTSAGKAKKARNRTHSSCEPCRQRKVEWLALNLLFFLFRRADLFPSPSSRRLSATASQPAPTVDSTASGATMSMPSRLTTPANYSSDSAEDELVAAREEIDRLKGLVKLLMQGAKNSNWNGTDLLDPASSSLLPTPSSSSKDALVDFPVLASPALPSTLLHSPPHNPYSEFTVSFPLLASAPTASSYALDVSAAACPCALPNQSASVNIAPPPVPAVAISGLPSFQPLPPEVDPLLFCG